MGMAHGWKLRLLKEEAERREVEEEGISINN